MKSLPAALTFLFPFCLNIRADGKTDISSVPEKIDPVISDQQNFQTPGGIYRTPVRFETEGRNDDMIFPYEFDIKKFNQYYN